MAGAISSGVCVGFSVADCAVARVDEGHCPDVIQHTPGRETARCEARVKVKVRFHIPGMGRVKLPVSIFVAHFGFWDG